VSAIRPAEAAQAGTGTSAHGETLLDSPRSDFLGGLGWMALGIAVLTGSVIMDRLERQDINPYTIPGLLPGLLGILLILLGGLLCARSWSRGGLTHGAAQAVASGTQSHGRIALVLALCLAYAVGLVGHGVPFWSSSSLYVFVTILALQHHARRNAGEKLNVRALLVTAAIALSAGITITLVFQQLFLVRLP
jgi:hypothetical protein